MTDAKQDSTKKVVVKKQQYFVPVLGKSVEAGDLDEVAEIIKKETAEEKTKADEGKE